MENGRRSSTAAQEGERARWQQSFGFLVDPAVHGDIILRQCRRDPPAGEQDWGLLRLPIAEIVARGSHHGWFVLSDERWALRSRVNSRILGDVSALAHSALPTRCRDSAGQRCCSSEQAREPELRQGQRRRRLVV